MILTTTPNECKKAEPALHCTVNSCFATIPLPITSTIRSRFGSHLNSWVLFIGILLSHSPSSPMHLAENRNETHSIRPLALWSHLPLCTTSENNQVTPYPIYAFLIACRLTSLGSWFCPPFHSSSVFHWIRYLKINTSKTPDSGVTKTSITVLFSRPDHQTQVCTCHHSESDQYRHIVVAQNNSPNKHVESFAIC